MLKVDVWNLLFTVINLLILFIAMKLFLFKPVKKIIAERQEEADRQFKEAAKHQQDADDLKAQYEKSIVEAQQESKQMLLDAKRSADTEYQKIIAGAKDSADEIRKNAALEAENEKARILKSAETEIAEMVLDATAKMVGAKKGADVDRALYNKFLDKAGDEA